MNKIPFGGMLNVRIGEAAYQLGRNGQPCPPYARTYFSSAHKAWLAGRRDWRKSIYQTQKVSAA